MKKIENYNLPEHTNKLYMNESISSIGLTHEIAKKINELVDAYNELSRTDLEWKQTQEGKINKGVLYMKDNLLNSLNELMELFRDSGFIDDRIEYHFNTIKANVELLDSRLSNLLGTVKSGSTTMDAEIIDARIGASGEQWASIGNAIRGQIKNIAYTIKSVVTDDNYLTLLPDANLIDEPCSYQLNFTYGATDIPANLPYTTFKSNVDELITFKDHYYRQLLIGNKYLYTRYGVKEKDGSITYYGWYCIYDSEKTEKIYNTFYGSKGIVTSSDYQIVLPDANGIMENSIYQLNFNYGSSDITANLPYKNFTGRIDELITFADKYYRQLLISDKYIYTRNGILNSTRDSVDYGAWILIWSPTSQAETIKYVVDKSGTGDYESLTKCLFENSSTKCEIYVRGGSYDLIEEFKEHFGTDIFSGTTLSYHGLPVDNGTKIYMDSDAEITFMYDGSNSVVEEYFSPFIMKNNGGELYGGRIICTNCRYAIHDDVYAGSLRSKSVIDGVYIHYNSARNVGIGGGLGQASNITVRNCVIISGRDDTVGYGIFYHNSATGNSKSHIVIENNYVKHNIVIEPYGTSTNISTAIVSNNNCNNVVKVMGGDIDNIELYDFNNITKG